MEPVLQESYEQKSEYKQCLDDINVIIFLLPEMETILKESKNNYIKLVSHIQMADHHINQLLFIRKNSKHKDHFITFEMLKFFLKEMHWIMTELAGEYEKTITILKEKNFQHETCEYILKLCNELAKKIHENFETFSKNFKLAYSNESDPKKFTENMQRALDSTKTDKTTSTVNEKLNKIKERVKDLKENMENDEIKVEKYKKLQAKLERFNDSHLTSVLSNIYPENKNEYEKLNHTIVEALDFHKKMENSITEIKHSVRSFNDECDKRGFEYRAENQDDLGRILNKFKEFNELIDLLFEAIDDIVNVLTEIKNKMHRIMDDLSKWDKISIKNKKIGLIVIDSVMISSKEQLMLCIKVGKKIVAELEIRRNILNTFKEGTSLDDVFLDIDGKINGSESEMIDIKATIQILARKNKRFPLKLSKVHDATQRFQHIKRIVYEDTTESLDQVSFHLNNEMLKKYFLFLINMYF